MKNTSRYIAATLLQQCEKNRSYANLALDAALKKAQLSSADASLCTALVYGVIERRRTLDYQLQDLLTKPLDALPAQTRAALRLGLYQLFFMRVPAHAAINESVALVKAQGAPHTAGLVNAVLRRAQGRGLMLPEDDLNVRYSVPEWLVELWRESYPDDYMQLLEHSFGGGNDIVLRVNTLKTTAEELAAQVDGEVIDGLPAVRVKSCDITKLPSFDEGLFHVQDVAAQLACAAVDPQPGDTVFDLCAAPGGKSFTLAQMMNDCGRVVATDLHANRVRLIEQGAARLGLSCIEARAHDAKQAHELGVADRVLCDVPCSGLGTLRKKPDIREKTAQELDKLPDIQYTILCAGAHCVAQHGVLVYATCTLNPAENEQVCARFAREHSDFTLDHMRTYMPHIDETDGFFVAKFIRHAAP
ncbi:MAG: 16S rRNA (cytosine(967)-C(5))-methyltransferase RsmB [Oscillospiraceae bacterium]|nr:16S rRNA (cytosine(967)-C(5))-methyltransferase RsmB [Oscillospiraceae bacterium]